MLYHFPLIHTIDDVLPHITGKDEFIVIDKKDYTVIDYVLNSADTFPPVVTKEYDGFEIPDITALVRRECRGITFAPDGKIISRPFHKFFNYGEKPDETPAVAPAHILHKLDGSMIRPIPVQGNIRLGTRKGVTDVSMQAETFIATRPEYIKFMDVMLKMGNTPIFEWCSRKNQIVLDYPEDNLILLAIRGVNTGHYYNRAGVEDFAKRYNIPVVEQFTIPNRSGYLAQEISEHCKTLKDLEGCVIEYANGHKLKAKGEWYTTLHKAKDMVSREKDMIKLYLDNSIDDLLPLFSEKDRKEIQDYLIKFTEGVFAIAKRIDDVHTKLLESMPDEFTRKAYAAGVLNLDAKYKPFMFALLDGVMDNVQPADLVKEAIIKACRSNTMLDKSRWLFGNIRFKGSTNET